VLYFSDTRKKLYFSGGITYGGFYNGTLLQYNAALTFRAQPWGNFTLSVENADIQLPKPYGSNTLFLIAPRLEINFSNNLFWTTFLQYNTQKITSISTAGSVEIQAYERYLSIVHRQLLHGSIV
jgi:hypothetical protein